MSGRVGRASDSSTTHAATGGFSFATCVLGDPQFKSEGIQALRVDVWAVALPQSLDVGVATKFFEPGRGIVGCDRPAPPAGFFPKLWNFSIAFGQHTGLNYFLPAHVQWD